MRHTELALRRPVACLMVFAAVAVIGLLSGRLLPLERFPDIDWPGMFVVIPYEGSTPAEVEREITRPVEEVLATLPGLRSMTSTSRESRVEVMMEFGWDHDMTTAGIDARARVEAIRDRLPADLRRIQIYTGSTGDQPIMVLRFSGDRDISGEFELLDRSVKRRIERLEGVSRVDLQGVEPDEIRILLDADRVAAHGLALGDLRHRLERSNFAVSAGRISADGMRFAVRPVGQFTSLDDIRELALNAAGLRLGDVAEIALRAPDRSYGRRLNGTYAAALNIYRTPGANIVEVADRVRDELARIGELPEMQGIQIFDLDNQATSIRQSLTDLLQAGLIGALLALAVLYVFLRQWRMTLLVTLSVPFALLITLAAMYFAGISLNILSMMGLMLAIGMLVDNSVVVTESIARYSQAAPEDPHGASIAGVREVGLAVIAGTATTIAVFAPIAFGEKVDITIFLTHVAVTITVAVIASLLIAQTLIPMLAARLPTPPPPRAGGWLLRLSDLYARALALALRRRVWTGVVVLSILVAGLVLPPRFITFDAFPQESSRRLFMPYHVQGIHSLDRVASAVERVEAYLLDNRDRLDIESVYSFYDEGRAESTILLREGPGKRVPTAEVIREIQAGLPTIAIGEPSFQFEQQGGGDGFQMIVRGDSTDVLADLVPELRRRLLALDIFENLNADLGSGEREVRISIDAERAARAGLGNRDIADAIRVALRGDRLREYRGDQGEIAVRLAYRESDRQSLEDLARLPLYTPDGDRVTLGSLAAFETVPAPRAIRRVDRETAVTLTGVLPHGVSAEEIRPRVREVMEEFELPPGYDWRFGRGLERTDQSQAIIFQSLLLAVVLIFIVMAALFESAIHPLSILVSIAFSIVGVLVFFALTGTTFSFMASIGIMILMGIVVNNGIVLVDHINNLRREGLPRLEAILTGGRNRLRPILMTVATTVLGLAPLALGTTQVGGDGPPYYPMARAIIGGLLFSTLVSLVVVPYVYSLLDDTAAWSRRVGRLGRPAPLA